MKKIISISLFALLLIPTIAFATNFQVGDEVFVTEVVNDDLYAAGGLVQVDSDVNGDLIIAGGKISVSGNVSQDLTLAGGDIYIKGEVGDDLRIGGGNVIIDSIIKDDLIIGAGNIDLSNESFVGGDITLGGGAVFLNGEVNGDVFGGAGDLFINSQIKGNVKLASVEKIEFGPNGRIMGNLTYKGPNEMELKEGAVQGKVNYTASKTTIDEEEIRTFMRTLIAGLSLYKLLAMLFAGLFLVWLLRYYVIHSTKELVESPFKSLGIGFLILALTPILALLFLITTIGLPIAILVLTFWFIALYFGKLMAAMLIGAMVIKLNDKSGFGRTYGAFALGTLVYVLLSFIPIVGWIIKLMLILLGMGAMASYELKLGKHLRDKKMI